MYYMITGERPDPAYNVKPLSELAPQVSDGIVYIVAKAMRLNPSKRYRSAAEMLTALRNVNKLDRRYIAMKVRREIVTAAAAAAVIGGIFLAQQGNSLMVKEQEEKLAGYVNMIDELIEQNDAEGAEQII